MNGNKLTIHQKNKSEEEMKNKSFVDCFMLIGTALSIKGPQKTAEMNKPFIQEVFTTNVTISLEIKDFRVVDPKNMVRSMNIYFTTEAY